MEYDNNWKQIYLFKQQDFLDIKLPKQFKKFRTKEFIWLAIIATCAAYLFSQSELILGIILTVVASLNIILILMRIWVSKQFDIHIQNIEKYYAILARPHMTQTITGCFFYEIVPSKNLIKQISLMNQIIDKSYKSNK